MRRLAIFGLMLAGACGPAPLDITVVAEPAIADDTLATVRTLRFSVSGAESAYREYPLASPFADQRQERVIYQAHHAAGSVDIAVDAVNGSRYLVAPRAKRSVQLGSGSAISVTIPLGEGGGDGGTDDMNTSDFAGGCVGQTNGAVCAPGDACHADASCLDGVCVANPVVDGTPCRGADACNGASTCSQGVCVANPLADGTPCAAADSCHTASTCASGKCIAHPLAEGTPCGKADSCNSAPTCIAEKCTAHPLTDGTVCINGDSCKNDALCSAGRCGAVSNKTDGTICSKAINACHSDGRCSGGACQGQAVLGEGASYDGVYEHRCCSGNPTDINTASNCSACGLSCNGGSCISFVGHYYCTCSANTQCWSGCCSTAYGSPYKCAAGDCNTNLKKTCPGSAKTGDAYPNGPYYCYY